jgi:MFS family permease
MSEELYNDEIEKHRRWNFFANAADLSAVNLASTFIYSTTILTLYASYLTSSAVLIGLIPALQQVGYLLPQLLSANMTERLENNKQFVVKVSVVERIPYLFVTLGIFLIPNAPPWLGYAVLAMSIGIATGAAGIATPAWKAMLGKLIHPDRRGALFAAGLSIGGLLGIGGTFFARRILNTYNYPISFALCFLLSFIFQSISWLFLTMNREPSRKPEQAHVSQAEYFRRLPGILLSNRNFSMFLLGSLFLIFGQMSVSFYIIYARFNFAISDGFAANLTFVALISQSLGTPILGRIGDRMGHKFLTEFSAILSMAAVVLMLIIPSVTWMYGVFFLMSLGMSGLKIARGAITMEFGSQAQMPTFVALSGTLLGIPTFLAPILGGAILDAVGYNALFSAALVFSAAGVLILKFRVHEPRVRRRM